MTNDKIVITETVLDGNQKGPISVEVDPIQSTGRAVIDDSTLGGSGSQVVVEVTNDLAVTGIEQLTGIVDTINAAERRVITAVDGANSIIDSAQQTLTDIQNNIAQIETARDQALASSQAAAASAATASTAATGVGDSATNAANSATTSTNSATASANSATASATSETNAASSAAAALVSQNAAATSAAAATVAQVAAQAAETDAETSATNAEAAEMNAVSSATNAQASEDAAEAANTAAQAARTAATTSETNAATSATASANSATTAGTAQTTASAAAVTAQGASAAAQSSAQAAAGSATAAATSASDAQDALENLRQEPIYQGVWDASSGTFPTAPATNAKWDVILSSGTSVIVGGFTWTAGNVLIYVQTTNTFSRRAGSASAVTSVNGDTGAVTVSTASIGALPAAGGTATGKVTIDRGTDGGHLNGLEIIGNSAAPFGLERRTGTNLGIRMAISSLTRYLGIDASGRLKFGNTTDLSSAADVYDTDNPPTPSEVGALPASGNTVSNDVTFSGNATFSNSLLLGFLSSAARAILSGSGTSLTLGNTNLTSLDLEATAVTIKGETPFTTGNRPQWSQVENKPTNILFNNSAANPVFGAVIQALAGNGNTADVQVLESANLGARLSYNGATNIATLGARNGSGNPWGNALEFPLDNSYVNIPGELRENGQRVYSPSNRPSAADVGARPSTYVPTFAEVTGKPAFTTRWPTYAEVTGKPTTFTPEAHTHPWAQVTGKPAFATRWPTFAEVSGKPTLLTQTDGDSRYGNIAGANTWSVAQTFSNGIEVTRTTNIGGTNFANGWIRLGTALVGLSMDSDELVSFGQNLTLRRSGGVPVQINTTGMTIDGNQVWHAGNDGQGSGLDADRLRGRESSANANANTLALRNSSGDLLARTVRTSLANQSSISGGIAFRVNSTTDNVTRFCNDVSAIRTFLSTYSQAEANARYLAINSAANGLQAQAHVGTNMRLYSNDGQGTAGWRVNFSSTATGNNPTAAEAGSAWQLDFANDTVNGVFRIMADAEVTANGAISYVELARFEPDTKAFRTAGNIYENGSRVFTDARPPTKSTVSLSDVANYAPTNDWNGRSTSLYATQVAVNDAAIAPRLEAERKRRIFYGTADPDATTPVNPPAEGDIYIQY